MFPILIICLAFFNLAALFHSPADKRHSNIIKLVLLDGFLLRLAMAFFYYGHASDMACWDWWSNMMAEHKPWGFYENTSFADYPPLYMYVMWFAGVVRKAFSIEGAALGVLLKLPAILADIGIGYAVYRFMDKKTTEKTAFYTLLLWVLNPLVMLNSAIWGQVDSVLVLLVLISLIYAYNKKFIISFIWFALGVITKPQALFYAPVLLYMVLDDCYMSKFNKENILKKLAGFFAAIGVALVLCAPFGIMNVINQYKNTLQSYPYFSVNAFNLWTALNLNWKELTPFGTTLGMLFIVLTVAVAFWYMLKSKDKGKIFTAAGFICFAVFTLSTKMHERYAFPAVLFLLVGAMLDRKNIKLFLGFLFVTATTFINTAYVLFCSEKEAFNAVAMIMGFITLTVLAYIIYVMLLPIHEKRKPIQSVSDNKIVRKDIVIMAAITLVYSVFAFYNLGNMKAPQNPLVITKEDGGSGAYFEENNGVSGMKLYLGEYHLHENNYLQIDLWDENQQNVHCVRLTEGSVFNWEEYWVELPEVSSITFSTNDKVSIMEFALLGKDGQLIKGSGGAFDEQDLVPERRSYLNSTHFDEIYHARTGYEFLEGDNVYEWTHPPLGKVFISWGIEIFGMTPFGWRIMGTLFGIFMLPIMYILGKKIFERRYIAAFTMLLFAADFMHFTQTRIATIDVYITFFIMLMYLFMADFVRQDYFAADKKKLYLPLFLSGLSFGLGVASKWTGVYAGAGLAVIYFIHLWENKDKESKEVFKKRTIETILWSVLFFVVIPLVIYVLSYIPFMRTNGVGIEGVIKNQSDMLSYHEGVTATHPFASEWFKWPTMYRPIWYYSAELADGMREGISAFGNPLVWWMGIPAFFYTAYMWILKKDKTARFLSIGYLAQLVPWILVSRITFIYHYFTAVPFVVLMIGYAAKNLIPDTKKGRSALFVYACLAVVLFLMFYPVISGQAVSVDYVKDFLKWSPEWVLVSGS